MLPVEQNAMTSEIIRNIDDAGVVAVLVIDELKHAIPLADALLEGGINNRAYFTNTGCIGCSHCN